MLQNRQKVPARRWRFAIVASVASLTLASCASAPTPQNLMATFNEADPAFNTAQCLAIRNEMLTYSNKVGQRVAAGVGLGLLLGPFGLPIAAMIDADQNNKTAGVNMELARRCVTHQASVLPPPTRGAKTVDLAVITSPAGAVAVLGKPGFVVSKTLGNIKQTETVTLEGQEFSKAEIIGQCITPCTLKVPRQKAFSLVVVKSGYISPALPALSWVPTTSIGYVLNTDNVQVSLQATR